MTNKLTKLITTSLITSAFIFVGCGDTQNLDGISAKQPHQVNIKKPRTDENLPDVDIWHKFVDITSTYDKKAKEMQIQAYCHKGISPDVHTYQVYIDSDGNNQTGFSAGESDWTIDGADYLIDDNALFKSTSDTEWKWEWVQNIKVIKTEDTTKNYLINFTLDERDIKEIFGDNPSANINISIEPVDKEWNDTHNYVSTQSVDIVEITQFLSSSKVYSFEMTLSHDYKKAYLAQGRDGFSILNIEDSSNPTLLSTYSIDADDFTTDLVLSPDGTKVFLVNELRNIMIMDVSDASNPTLLNSIEISAHSVAISPDGNKIYITDGGDGMKIYDVSDISNPKHLSEIDLTDYAEGIVLSSDGSKAFVITRGKIDIIDVNDALNPRLLNEIVTTRPRNIIFSEDETTAYVASTKEGLKIYDIRDASNPQLISAFDTHYALDVALSEDGSKAFISDHDKVLLIIDLSDISNPTLVDAISTNGSRILLSEDKTIIYIDNQFKVLNISRF